MRTIVVPLDGSTLAERAVAVARSISRETGAPVRLVEVATPAEVESAHRYLESVADALLSGSDPAIDVIEAEVGESVGVCLLGHVASQVADARLCMSTHGRSGFGSALWGSTAEDVMRHTHEPVLLVGRHCDLPWPGHRRGVLVPIDGSPRCNDLLVPVAELVREHGLQPTIIKVVHPFDVEDAHDPMAGLDEAGHRLAELGVEAKLEHRFASNVPVTLVEAARESAAAVVVMASYVHPGAARTFLGSVTMRTVHDAPCPVLVFPRIDRDVEG